MESVWIPSGIRRDGWVCWSGALPLAVLRLLAALLLGALVDSQPGPDVEATIDPLPHADLGESLRPLHGVAHPRPDVADHLCVGDVTVAVRGREERQAAHEQQLGGLSGLDDGVVAGVVGEQFGVGTDAALAWFVHGQATSLSHRSD
jgi:hypothetical protein